MFLMQINWCTDLRAHYQLNLSVRLTYNCLDFFISLIREINPVPFQYLITCKHNHFSIIQNFLKMKKLAKIVLKHSLTNKIIPRTPPPLGENFWSTHDYYGTEFGLAVCCVNTNLLVVLLTAARPRPLGKWRLHRHLRFLFLG